MANMETGELYTQEQFDRLTPEVRDKTVSITPQESTQLQGMNRTERRKWLKQNKKLKSQSKKRERQNRKAGRRG